MTWQTQFETGEVVYRDEQGLVLCGNALDVLKGFPDNSISCVVTSPPYFHLRKYGCEFDWPDGWHGELGLEPTMDMFLDHLMLIFGEIWRVLRPDGTLWVNIADKMSGGQMGNNLCELRDDLTEEEKSYVLTELAKCKLL